jgi:hypothetical protein
MRVPSIMVIATYNKPLMSSWLPFWMCTCRSASKWVLSRRVNFILLERRNMKLSQEVNLRIRGE